MNAADRPSVSITRAQQLASVSRRTIYNWLARNKVEYVRTASGSVRIYADTLFRPGNVAPGGASIKETE